MNEEYIDNVKELIGEKDADKVKELLIDLHPADIAELCNELNPEEARFVYRLLDNETAADVLVEMDEDVRKEFLDILPSETIAKRFVDYMDTDDAVDLMRELDEDKQEEVLSHIEDIEQAGDIVDLLKYDENTAGGLMGTEMVTVNENWSMPECLKEMRQQAEELDDIYYVYVIDDDERLRGIFPLKKMITSPSVSKVKHVMQKDPISVHVDTPIDEVAQIIEKYVAKWANENGKLISHLNASKIISNVGDDLNLLKNEVNKIAAYAKGEEITDRDIDLLSTVNLEARTYDMADDVINGRGDRAFRKIDTLFCQREEPINILYALSSAYVDAYRMRVADECSVSKETVAKDFAYKNRAFVLNRARTSVSRTSTEALRKSLDVLVETDEKLSSIVDAPIIETNGFRVFSDKEKQSLIRKIAETRGILIMTDSDGAGFVIRNFLKGSVDNSKIINCYIPQIKGKEKRKAKGGKEGLLGVEGVSDEVIINAIRKSGAEIIGEENNIPERKITKADLFVLGLTGTENSEINRKKILKKLGLPSYLSTNAFLTAINCLYSFEELKEML